MTDLLNPKIIKELLAKHNVFAKKSFGQNFLISSAILDKILETAQITPEDHIVEVGPGLGVLTRELTKRAKKVTSIELDKTLLPILAEIATPNLEIINSDALKFTPPNTPYKVVANIPYNITSPLISHFLQNKNKPQAMTLLIQKEVAEKICTLTPQMTVLALGIALFGETKIAALVKNTKFYPAPKVDSAILQIKVAPKFPDELAQKILKTAKQAFLGGRKKLSNTLPELRQRLADLNLGDQRPQHLTLENWAALLA